MSAQFAIRSATNADLPAIRSVLLAVRSEFDVVDQTGGSDNDLNDLQSHYFDCGGIFQVVVDKSSNSIVGCAALCPLNRSRAELCKMYILKAAHWQRTRQTTAGEPAPSGPLGRIHGGLAGNQLGTHRGH